MKLFPWNSLVSVAPSSRTAAVARTGPETEASRNARLAGLARRYVDPTALQNKLTAFAKQPASVVWTRGRDALSVLYARGNLAMQATRVDCTPDELPFVLVVEGALACRVVAAALGLPAPTLLNAQAPLPPALAGACAAVVVEALRAATDGAWHVHAAKSPATLLEPLGLRSPADILAEYAPAEFSVLLGAETFSCTLLVPLTTVNASADDLFRGRILPRLPLRIPLVLAQIAVQRADLAALSVGDVVHAELPIAADPAGRLRLRGAALCCPPSAEDGLSLDINGASARVRTTALVPCPWDAVLSSPPASSPASTPSGAGAHAMSSPALPPTPSTPSPSANPSPTDPGAMDVWLQRTPVVVRVELGAATLLAAEWSALREGDTIALESGPEAGVLLRAAGHIIARGELVLHAGKVGVRITERIE